MKVIIIGGGWAGCAVLCKLLQLSLVIIFLCVHSPLLASFPVKQLVNEHLPE